MLLKRLVFEALQAIPKVIDVGQSGVSARQACDSTVRGRSGRGAADGRKSLGIAALGLGQKFARGRGG